MNNKPVLFGIIGLLVGFGIAAAIRPPVNTQNTDITTSEESMGMGSSMDDMMKSMTGKTGDQFDATFLSSMIVHHEGAVSMAQEALKSATHEEIKMMAQDIISAQTKEIGQMKAWQKQWGY